jgi:hypothetical protein
VYSSAGKHEVALKFCENAARLLEELKLELEEEPDDDILRQKDKIDNILTAMVIAH